MICEVLMPIRSRKVLCYTIEIIKIKIAILIPIQVSDIRLCLLWLENLNLRVTLGYKFGEAKQH
jgi:hypothetical protein